MTTKTIRQELEEREHLCLSSRAAFADESTGRPAFIEPNDVRTAFQRDRDRIIHSKAFRRLMHKTQVFLSPEEDHYRTRLTHTLEVTQIARTIARALRLNEDLCEAIGLGHDLGHTPFGHAGERLLQRCYDPTFTHYKQSLRVVDKLEPMHLTDEVRDGILCHTNAVARTLEGRIVRLADRIAYINHDIDDACRAGIIQIEDIPLMYRNVMGDTGSDRIDFMVRSVIEASAACEEICMKPEDAEMTEELHQFLYANVYRNPIAKGEEGKAEEMLGRLYEHFSAHPDKMPAEYRAIAQEESPQRAVCDYISGMSDRYAIHLFRSLFIPEVWGGTRF